MLILASLLAFFAGPAAMAQPSDPSPTCSSEGKITSSEVQNLHLHTKKATESPRPWVRMKFGFNLVLDGAHCAGDKIEISAPRQLGPNGEPVALAAPDGTVIARAEYRDWKVTVTLTDAVENPNYFGFRGDAWWEVSLLANVEVGENVLEWAVDGKTIRTPIVVAPCDNCSTIPLNPAKWGWATGGRGGVTLQFPTATSDGQLFTWSDELLSSNQAIDCTKLEDIATAYSQLDQWGSATDRKKIPFTVSSCSSTEVHGTITVDQGWKAQVGLPLILDPKDPGPWADRATFESGETWTREAIVRRSESGGSGMYQSRTVVSPAAPTLRGNVTCTQCGDFSQQAKVLIPSTDGVKYFLNDAEVSAGEYPVGAGQATVKAVAVDPSKTILEGQTVWRFSVEACKCPDTKVQLVNPVITPGACEAGSTTPTEPTVTVAETRGITYGDPEVTVSDSGAITVVVTATPESGYAIDTTTLPQGWAANDDGSATFTGSGQQPDCTIRVRLSVPALQPGTCQVGSLNPTEPTVTTPATDGIAYGNPSISVNGKAVIFTVTATPESGYAIDTTTLPQGWAANDDGSATFTGSGQQPDCDPTAIEPASPSVAPGVCMAGSAEPTEPTVVTPEDSGVIDYGEPVVKREGRTVIVTITATLKSDAYILGVDLPEGWQRISGTEAVFTASVEQPDCRIGVAPADPTVTPVVCQAGSAEPAGPTVVVPSTKGIVYGEPTVKAEGKKVIITLSARAEDGHVLDLGRATKHWVMRDDDGTAVFVRELELGTCAAASPPASTPTAAPPTPTTSPTATPRPPVPPRALAKTGSPILPILVIAAALIGSGALLMRRRR